ncbi:uncharacterized protein MYCFIDRAFT_170805 [Pseudocercospora fijiensis CIRAD86]|uniref:Uncharacterized protein n=1 Tax=Pseudocercospora fijiensis (strain CIRAD86) TaxID=383855 RepID=N1Q8X2_PSEFD|nr:uncharacterized protein MYCFIDRAFT_170805 [Pseudocercospora fijiensis CIRAD86]EME89340.1 hypothetical protein MYCFIDRAFT_170805 [Pseudocercospora fijiensis CIRAD86]
MSGLEKAVDVWVVEIARIVGALEDDVNVLWLGQNRSRVFSSSGQERFSYFVQSRRSFLEGACHLVGCPREGAGTLFETFVSCSGSHAQDIQRHAGIQDIGESSGNGNGNGNGNVLVRRALRDWTQSRAKVTEIRGGHISHVTFLLRKILVESEQSNNEEVAQT